MKQENNSNTAKYPKGDKVWRFRGLLFFLSFFVAMASNAARVDSVNVMSKAMNLPIKTVVVLPDAAYKSQEKCPVVYLLHGYTGNQKDWIGMKPNLPQIADEKGIIFVCPDGKNNWYFDSPIDKTSQYETFISSELVDYIDKNYQTKADRKFRAITGLSMGGHGALYNAFRHKDVFGAAGSMSGAIDIRERGENLGLVALLGNVSTHKENWEMFSVINQLDKISNGDLEIYVDCGVKDFVFDLNEKFNKILWEKGIDHEYVIRPGEHNAAYWNNSIDYHILFFSKFFEKNK